MTQDVADAFRLLTGFAPMRWQQRLSEKLLRGDIPAALALPTGLGKTSVMTLWLIARGLGAPLPRRLVYIVDRRVVVDQASAEAQRLRHRLHTSAEPVLARLRQGLDLGEGTTLAVSALRGGLSDDAAWRADPAACAIIVGTVDMIGSRLLFEGYGVSRRMRPLHAGLLGCDTLAVLDEAHLVPPFAALLRSIAQDTSLRGGPCARLVPGMRVMTLSATGGEAADADHFRLQPEEAEEELVKRRLHATKRLCLAEAAPRKELPTRLAERARELAGTPEKPARVIVFCDRRTDAQQVVEHLASDAPGFAVHLLVGERRGHERSVAAEEIEQAGFVPRDQRQPPTRPTILVATAAGEVGADFDADHMVADVVSFERMVQRLGRVNRRGGEERAATVVLIPAEKHAKANPDEAKRDARAAKTLELLRHLPNDGDAYDASPAALDALQREAALRDLRAAATTPEPLRPALTRALVESWSLTGLVEHTGRPEIAPWLRGWVDDEPEVRLLWRRFLPWRADEPVVPREVSAFFEHAPPAPAEVLEAPVWRAVDVLKARAHALPSATEEHARPGALVLTPALEFERALTVGELADLEARKAAGELSGRLIVVRSGLGGLSGEGLLDAKAEGAAPDAPGCDRGIACTVDSPAGMNGVMLRVSVGAAEEADPPEEGWVEAHSFPLALDAEGAPVEVLRVWTPERAQADPALARRLQALADHAAAVERAVAAMADRLGLPPEFRCVLRHAARLHDAGKAAERWQDAFSAPKEGRPYAKTAARRVDQARLDGYRHEFGSLEKATHDPVLSNLPNHLRDLALHLIAAHHGRARPVIETNGAPLMPSAAKERARKTTLRFAQLQQRWGPWGLAWWEALLRCADAAASAALEKG